MGHVVRWSELGSREASPVDFLQDDVTRNVIPFEFVEQAAPTIERDVEDEDEMDFCLFAPTPGKPKAAQASSKIRLKSPSLTNAEPGLENPNRDPNYYFTKPLGPEELQELASIAVSGKDIKARSCERCAGNSYPWKVRHIQATRAQALVLAKASAVYDDLVPQDPTKRKRPGKKSRIKSRTRLALLKATEVENQKAAELKEAADREKRTRRNREKKAKKKVREKAKKAAGAAGAVEGDGSDSEDDGSSQAG